MWTIPTSLDLDEDSIGDVCDNCPDRFNPSQADDQDAFGDDCDNCPVSFNPDQNDGTRTRLAMHATTARMKEINPGRRRRRRFQDACDNCVYEFNQDQADSDGDGWGDLCDLCPTVYEEEWLDADADGIGDACDNCPFDENEYQVDDDGDGTGNACDLCPGIRNYDVYDSDGDGAGDVCDNCPLDSNPDQLDTDNDGIGDVCDRNPFVRGGGSRCATGPGGPVTAGILSLVVVLAGCAAGVGRGSPERSRASSHRKTPCGMDAPALQTWLRTATSMMVAMFRPGRTGTRRWGTSSPSRGIARSSRPVRSNPPAFQSTSSTTRSTPARSWTEA